MEREERSKKEKAWARIWGEKWVKKSEKGREGKRKESKEIEGEKSSDNWVSRFFGCGVSFKVSIISDSNQRTRASKEEWDALSRNYISVKGKGLPERQKTIQEGILEPQSKIKDTGGKAIVQLEARILCAIHHWMNSLITSNIRSIWDILIFSMYDLSSQDAWH